MKLCISSSKYFLLYSVSMSQKTFLAVKPESFKRNDTVGIVKMLEEKLDAKCLAMKAYTPSEELAEAHYAVHKERPSSVSLFHLSLLALFLAWFGKVKML